MEENPARGALAATPSGSPSAWPARIAVAVLALTGCVISTYLALFQYHVVHTVWEPFFDDGSRRVLTSAISRALPVSDAALGVAGYLFEAVIELCGGQQRWRRKPWLVLLVGVTVAALAIIGLLLVISQPLLTGTFCTLCLCSAAISFAIAALARHEVVAAVRVVRERHARGLTLWTAAIGSR